MPKTHTNPMDDFDEKAYTPDAFNADEEYDFGDEEMDISEAKEFVFEPLPPNRYPSSCVQCEYGRTKEKQKPCLKWQFQVHVEGDDGKNHNRTVFMTDVLDADGFGRVKSHLIAVNPDFDLVHFTPRTCGLEMVGRDCVLRLGIGKPFGDPPHRNNEVKEVMPAVNELAFLGMPA